MFVGVLIFESLSAKKDWKKQASIHTLGSSYFVRALEGFWKAGKFMLNFDTYNFGYYTNTEAAHLRAALY